MSENELPRRRLTPSDLVIPDSEEFLKQVPQLIAQLRLRMPVRAWELDLSPASLMTLDDYLAREIDKILSEGLKVYETIDPDLLKELTAYVGEVFAHDKGAKWQVSSKDPTEGPDIVFDVPDGSTGRRRPKVIDIYEHILRVVVEGESLSRWYNAEKD